MLFNSVSQKYIFRAPLFPPESRNADVRQKSCKWQVKKYLSPCLGSDSLHNLPKWKGVAILSSTFFFFLLFFIPSLSRSPNRVLVLVDVGVFLSRFSLFWYFYLDMRVVSLLARGGTFLAQQLLISLLSLSYWKWKSAALLVWFHVVQHFQVLHATLHTVSVWTPIFLCRKEVSTHFPFLVTCFLLLVTCHLSPFSSIHTAFSDNP